MTKNKENFEEFLTNPRISRAFETCLLTIGEKIDNKNEEQNEKYKTGLKNIGDFFVENYQKIIEDNIAIYVLRSFIRVVGTEDPFESFSAKDKSLSNKTKYKKNDNNFSIKDIKPKLIPDEWKIHSYLKKFAQCTANFTNVLGNLTYSML
jgi:hypothetical protein